MNYLLESPEFLSGSPIFLHSLGTAIPRAVNLALQIEQTHPEKLIIETQTQTVDLTGVDLQKKGKSETKLIRLYFSDDFEARQGSRTRPNSAVHIKIRAKTVISTLNG